MFTPTTSEIERLLAQVEQAIHNHDRWHEAVVTTLMCRLPYDERDVQEDAFRRCRFGQWLYGEGQKVLGEHISFAAIESEHRRMHQIASSLLCATAAGATLAVQEYELFAGSFSRLRLESSTLKHELEDMRLNRDALTGTNNRTSLLTVLRELQALVKRQIMPCSLAMLDLDHFKAVNDTHGHQVGDHVLVVTAQYFMQHLRPYDKMFRYGGEEFVISLQNTKPEVAVDVLERLREGLAKTPIYHNDVCIGVTVSCGVAALDAATSVEESVEHADRALYAAKAAGRNCTRQWEAALPVA